MLRENFNTVIYLYIFNLKKYILRKAEKTIRKEKEILRKCNENSCILCLYMNDCIFVVSHQTFIFN